jgi:hypothetical protein
MGRIVRPGKKKKMVPSDPLAQLCFLTVMTGRNDGNLGSRISFRHFAAALVTPRVFHAPDELSPV